jgi:hypothetical protein
LCDDDFVTGRGEVGQPLARFDVEHERARRNARDLVLAAAPVLAFPATVFAASGLDSILELEVEERGETAVGT